MKRNGWIGNGEPVTTPNCPPAAHQLILAASVAAISLLHYASNPHWLAVHELLKRVYYVPIVIAATRFGVARGMATSILAMVLYLPQTRWSAESGHHMFEPFVDGGSNGGLTLAVAKRLIEDQNGAISAEHATAGVRIIVELPLVGAAIPKERSYGQAQASA